MTHEESKFSRKLAAAQDPPTSKSRSQDERDTLIQKVDQGLLLLYRVEGVVEGTMAILHEVSRFLKHHKVRE